MTFTEILEMKRAYYNRILCYHGIPGQKWGVRRGPPYPLNAGGGQRKTVAKSKKYGKIKKSEFTIHKSLGAKAKNYRVFDPATGRYYPFVEGTRIKNPTVFAGKGGVKKLRPEVALGLSEQIGGKPSEWQHCKGVGTLDCDGEEYEAEVHWFQEPSVGKHKFLIKKWFFD